MKNKLIAGALVLLAVVAFVAAVVIVVTGNSNNSGLPDCCTEFPLLNPARTFLKF